MTQSKTKEDNFTITIGEPDTTYGPVDGTYKVDLGDMWSSESITLDSSITLDTSPTYTFDTGVFKIDPDEVEDMCKHYPGLDKVWRNFKSVYDMCIQDYKGKMKEDGLDDDIPF